MSLMTPAQPRTLGELETVCLSMRRHVLRMIHAAGSGHPGSSLSEIELMAGLWFHEMHHDPQRPDWPRRDRFILSKGHGVPTLYAAMAEAGYLPADELTDLRKLGSRLQGHPSVREFDLMEASTGSLGQGLSFGIGEALADRMDGLHLPGDGDEEPARRVFVMMGDGECQEGQVWEAVLAAPRYELDNLVGIVDYNKFQLDDSLENILPLDPLAEKFKSFGWHVIEINGHDLTQVTEALAEAGDRERHPGVPAMIVAHTVKGQGVSFMENDNKWHGVAPNDDEFAAAMEELGGDDE